MSTCLFTDIPSEWEKVIIWSIAKLWGKGLQTSLGKLCLDACIYHHWQQINALVHNNNLRTKEAIVKQIT
jgi:RimJ/RimL family protein N-acetyltransferase